jgi:hypothetical protein
MGAVGLVDCTSARWRRAGSPWRWRLAADIVLALPALSYRERQPPS